MEKFAVSGQPLEEPITDWKNSFAAIVISKQIIFGFISGVELTEPRTVTFTSDAGEIFTIPAFYNNFHSISKAS